MARGKINNYSKLFGGLDIAKDSYDQNRQGMVDSDGNYHYITGLGMQGSATTDIIPLHATDEDGNPVDNTKLIMTLAGMDHEANVQKNNAARWTDYRVTNYQVASNNDLDQKKAVDPMDAEAFRRYMEELFRGDEAGDEKRDPIQEFVHKFLRGLSDADQAIMFGYFGSCETQQKIGDELGRQVQSVNRTINRIKKRLEKELADKLGYTGQDRHKAEK